MNEMTSEATGISGYDDESYEPTTELRVWTGGGYDTFGWSGNLLEDSPNMADEMGVTDHSMDNKWLNDGYEVSDLELGKATGYWIKAGSTGTVTFSGEVPTDDTITVEISAGLNLVSFPWPMAAGMEKISVTGQSSYDDDSYEPTTELRIWTGGGYDTFGWTGNLLDDCPNMADEMGITDHSMDNKWLTDSYEVSEVELAMGQGFWIKASAAGTVVFSK